MTLIDNLAVNVEGWIAVGGEGYLFTTDDAFVADVGSGRVPGFEAGDLAPELPRGAR